MSGDLEPKVNRNTIVLNGGAYSASPTHGILSKPLPITSQRAGLVMGKEMKKKFLVEVEQCVPPFCKYVFHSKQTVDMRYDTVTDTI